jgi:hypothetical protein
VAEITLISVVAALELLSSTRTTENEERVDVS